MHVNYIWIVSLTDLYDPLTMPDKLRKAHIANDKAVMSAYGFSMKMTEADSCKMMKGEKNYLYSSFSLD